MLAKMSEILIYVSLKQTKDKNIPQIRVTSYATIIITNFEITANSENRLKRTDHSALYPFSCVRPLSIFLRDKRNFFLRDVSVNK